MFWEDTRIYLAPFLHYLFVVPSHPLQLQTGPFGVLNVSGNMQVHVPAITSSPITHCDFLMVALPVLGFVADCW